MRQLQSFWDGLDARRRLVAVLSAVAILAAIYGISRVATEPSLAMLYSGLDSTAAGEVVAELEAEGVVFQVDGSAIMVDHAARDRIRMALAAKGLPAGGPAGYEILDNLSGFGTTSQMFDAAYWRAKEGELARTITGSPNVRTARVHLANPVSQPFSRTPAGSASVTVTMARGELDRGQAEAIRYLVSSAVAGVAPEAVAVIDAAKGVVLAGKEDALTAPAARTPAQRRMRANIQRMLEARVGPGRAIVEVNVDADMDSQTITERTDRSRQPGRDQRPRPSRAPKTPRAPRPRSRSPATSPTATSAARRAATRATPPESANGRTSRSPRPAASG